MLDRLARRPRPLRRLLRQMMTALIAPAMAAAMAGGATADLPRLDVTPKTVRQGDCVFVVVQPGQVAPAAGECKWLGTRYPLFAVPSGYRAILPVPPDTAAGIRFVVVVLTDPAGETRQTELPLTVVKRQFAVQKLRMTQKATRLYTDPAAAQEGKTIHAALTQISDEQLWHGAFAWPYKGRVSTDFGAARSINGRIDYRHNGLDIAAPAGAPVYAPAGGMVKLVRQDYKLHGKTVVIDHGQGVSSLYLHLSQIAVKEGQGVAEGDLIGSVGSTGAATGPHLHWGVYIAGQAVDPRFWINLPQVGR